MNQKWVLVGITLMTAAGLKEVAQDIFLGHIGVPGFSDVGKMIVKAIGGPLEQSAMETMNSVWLLENIYIGIFLGGLFISLVGLSISSDDYGGV